MNKEKEISILQEYIEAIFNKHSHYTICGPPEVKIDGNVVNVSMMVRVVPPVDFIIQGIDFGFLDKACGEDLDRLSESFDIKRTPCSHEWAEYVGLKESFKYCKKCDKKQE